jgi:tRNA (guanine37-N1)-methyltransferase
MARELSEEKSLIILCGRYEGVDQRIIDTYIDDEISIGDYVISSGEIAALVLIDGVYRLLDGVINQESLEEESFEKGILEYPHYTRPVNYKGQEVPEILLSGHHENIRKWRLQKGLEKTRKNRPDLLQPSRIDAEAWNMLKALEEDK